MYEVVNTMSDGNSKKSKLSWPKTLVKKWFNLQNLDGDFHADDIMYEGDDKEWNNKVTQGDAYTIKKNKTEKSNRRNHDDFRQNKINLGSSQTVEVQDYRMFVATWNVAGKSPPSHLNLQEWLNTSPAADIYVLGFQEVVPLNAGNVLGTEDNAPTRKWQALIRKTLNDLPCVSNIRSDDYVGGSFRKIDSSFLQCHSSDDEGIEQEPSESCYYTNNNLSRYCLVASKQMVGLFLTVWIKSDLRDGVRNLNVSCVGRGLMGYLGNKGAISISMSLQETSFCFVCSHLTSGEKDGDELRRNSDVMEILKKTRFPQQVDSKDLPQTILDHDRIIWLGDLNYRISLSYRCAKALVEMQNWRTLLENDQLRTEQKHGRVFAGWNEGRIYFPPTYKYSNNSDRYAGEKMHPKEKRRTPAWCDRILWHGHGLRQLSYVRGESKFSDHRPVYSLFLARVESANCSRIKRSPSYSSSRVEIEEMLPLVFT